MNILDPSTEGKITVTPYIFAGLTPSVMYKVSKQYHAMYGTTFKRILETCCELFNVPVKDAMSKSRLHEMICARRAYMAICRNHIGSNYTKIAKTLGKNHATIIHNVRAHNDWMIVYPKYAATYRQIEEKLKLDKKYERTNVAN